MSVIITVTTTRTYTDCFLCTKCYAKIFTYIIVINTHNSPMMQVLFLSFEKVESQFREVKEYSLTHTASKLEVQILK